MVETLFTTETPAIGDQGEALAGLTLGTAFYPTVDGTVPGVRRYKASTPPDTTAIGGLYLVTSNGAATELATAAFDDSTDPWAVALFTSPITVFANTLYVAAYWVPGPTVHYVASGAFFTADLVSGHLVGIQTGTNPTGLAGNIDNGRYVAGGTIAFPTNTFNSNNYFADPMFIPAGDIAAEGSGPAGVLGLAAGLKSARGTAPGVAGALGVAAGVKSGRGAGPGALGVHGLATGPKQGRGAGILVLGLRGMGIGSKAAAGTGPAAVGALGSGISRKQADASGALVTAALGLNRTPTTTGAPARGTVAFRDTGTVNIVDRPGVTLR